MAADYGEVGIEAHRFGAYGIAPIRRDAERQLERRFREAIRKHAPSLHLSGAFPEVHMQELQSGNKRAKGAFSELKSFKDLDRFLRTLCSEIVRIVPFVIVVASHLNKSRESIQPSGDSPVELLRQALWTADVLMASHWYKRAGSHVLRVDRGDSFKLGKPPIELALDASHGLRLVSECTFELRDSSVDRLVQVADIAAYIGGRYMALKQEYQQVGAEWEESRRVRVGAELSSLLDMRMR